MGAENVTEKQLDTEVEEQDLPNLAPLFDNVDDYYEMLKLTPGEQNDVREAVAKANSNQTQKGVKVALKCWRKKNPMKATYRCLLHILLTLEKGDIAINMCKYMTGKCKLKLLFLQC